MRILILHGPNLNLLGRREPAIYGTTTLDEINSSLCKQALSAGAEADCRQSNHEGQLIDWLQEAFMQDMAGLVINPGGLSHTSVSLRDALALLAIPKVEVHLSNVFKREEFRQHSLISPVVDGLVAGLGSQGYTLALEAVLTRVKAGLHVV
jgi:3-dehydroquinate dehydratase-2